MLIVDTGPLVAYLNASDPDHVHCATLFEQRDDQLLVTPYVVTEACYLIAKYVGSEAEATLVESILAGDLVQVDVRDTDLSRIVELMRQYRGFPLGLADSSVAALAERLNAREVVTLDRRHFHAIVPKHVDAFTLLP
jgi:predicted nucleic acid-binding protein